MLVGLGDPALGGFVHEAEPRVGHELVALDLDLRDLPAG